MWDDEPDHIFDPRKALPTFDLLNLFKGDEYPSNVNEAFQIEYDKIAEANPSNHTLKGFKEFMDVWMKKQTWKKLINWILNYEVLSLSVPSLQKPPKPARIFLDPYPMARSEDAFQDPAFEPLILDFLDDVNKNSVP